MACYEYSELEEARLTVLADTLQVPKETVLAAALSVLETTVETEDRGYVRAFVRRKRNKNPDFYNRPLHMPETIREWLAPYAR